LLNTILGSFSSGVVAVPGSYESIATVTVGGGGSASATFSSIPATYTHLQIRMLVRGASGSDINIYGQYNSDTGSNYRTHALYGTGSSAAAYASNQQTIILAGRATGSSNTASAFGVCVLDILDYANTNKYTTSRNLTGWDGNGSGQIWFESGLWLNTAAVTSITLTGDASFAEHSQFALYGIKG
jgi:hypothetical protein